jgi:hypothetical protein
VFPAAESRGFATYPFLVPRFPINNVVSLLDFASVGTSLIPHIALAQDVKPVMKM